MVDISTSVGDSFKNIGVLGVGGVCISGVGLPRPILFTVSGVPNSSLAFIGCGTTGVLGGFLAGALGGFALGARILSGRGILPELSNPKILPVL